MLRGLFARAAGRRQAERDAAERVKRLAWAALAFPDDTELTVSEIECLDPSCPGLETVLLVMGSGRRTRAVKVAKAMADVTEDDLRDAFSGLSGSER